MSILNAKVNSIRVLKNSLSLDLLGSIDLKASKVILARKFTVKLDIDNETVSIAAGMTLQVTSPDGDVIDPQNLVVETLFSIKNLVTHTNEEEELQDDATIFLVNLAYHHTRAIQATYVNSTSLERYLIPIVTLNEEKDIEDNRIKE